MHFLSKLVGFGLVAGVFAHPGHDIRQEIAERAAYMARAPKRDLSSCAAKLKARGVDRLNVQRRAALVKAAREKRGIDVAAPYLKARTFAEVLATNHTSPVVYSPDTDESVLFSGENSCVLTPEVTQGPYYVNGEYVRKDIRETQAGVELILDTQVIDVATCEPVAATYVDIWHCNSTGVYGGVVASGNGAGTADASNINKTFLRGLQETDEDGVSQFITTFPGHYSGRAPHIHVAAHFGGTAFANGTYNGGYVSHVGQIFFDQDLIYEVEATSPYSTNKQSLVLNAADGIMSQESATSDPVIEYSLIGDTVADGIFGWLAFGIDLTEQQTLTGAATLTASGGVANSGGSSGGGPGSPP